MQRNAPLPISNTGSLHVFPLVVCSSLELSPRHFPLPPFRDRRTNYYRQYERARRMRVVGSIMDTKDRGFKVHGALVSSSVPLYRCHRSTPGVVSRVQLEIPSVAPLPQIKTEECKCALVHFFSPFLLLPSSLPFVLFFLIVICVHSKNHNDHVMRSRENPLEIMNYSARIRTCLDPTFHRLNLERC